MRNFFSVTWREKGFGIEAFASVVKFHVCERDVYPWMNACRYIFERRREFMPRQTRPCDYVDAPLKYCHISIFRSRCNEFGAFKAHASLVYVLYECTCVLRDDRFSPSARRWYTNYIITNCSVFPRLCYFCWKSIPTKLKLFLEFLFNQ